MKWDKLLINTQREAPTDAETISNKLMLRAALVRKLSSGVYVFLPLGMRVLLKVTNIVREEMNRAGAQEVLLPVLQPIELLRETGRDKDLAPILLTTQDRGDRLHVLGPTHEEIITHVARLEISSHRQLPLTAYQIQVKFRDEPRPRGGLLRTKEFIMKDAYSFNKDWECLDKTYKEQYTAYMNIFRRCGVNVYAVEADTGAMGGRESHEFMCPSDSGEDSMVFCSKCSYAANVEKAECLMPTKSVSDSPSQRTLAALEEVATPGRHTVDEVAKFLNACAENVVKTIIVRGDKKYYACLIRGDHELNLTKIRNALKERIIELAAPEEVEKVTSTAFGFTGPVGLKKGIDVICDNAVENMQNFITGGNKKDVHLKNVNLYRDFKPLRISDIRLIKNGDPCPRCLAPISVISSIEVGHIFKLGTKYSEAMGLNYLTEKGEKCPVIMGCYGIGITRIISAVIESHHDSRGIIWPKEVSPFDVHLVSVNPSDQKVYAASERLHDELATAGLDVIWDNRDVSAGVKFADADLLGIPIRLIVGKKFVEKGMVDVKTRADGRESEVEPGEVVGVCKSLHNSLPF